MSYKLTYGIVKYRARKVVHVVRNTGGDLALPEINDVVEMVWERMLSRHGEQTTAVVFVQGNTKETLRLFGDSYAVALVRTAMFDAAVSWSPISLD
jgi:hypothetical protein